MRILIAVLFVGVLLYTLNQVRKPSKWYGRLFLRIMNASHSPLTDWGLQHVRIEKQFTILDVGCGGGRTIQKLAALAVDGKVYGVDYADGSVAASRASNASPIAAGRVEIRQASVSALPFPNDTFDVVTAVETQYYWPDLVNDMREILRVLKPGGRLVVILESYSKVATKAPARPAMKLLPFRKMSVDDQINLFATAGFTGIETFQDRRNGWFCGVGQKTAEPLRHDS